MYNIIDICHVNIRSLRDGKIDTIKAELMLKFDICLTETNLPYAIVTVFDQRGFHDILYKDKVAETLYDAEHLDINQLYKYDIPELKALKIYKNDCKSKNNNHTMRNCA